MDLKEIVEKTLWTERDFDKMGWHDCPIYGIRFDSEVILDIDYIFKWVLDNESKYYSFWISPATLVFPDACNLKINVDLDFINGLEIADLNKCETSEKGILWNLETQEGDISLISSGFKQYIRRKPILVKSQCLSEEQRGGYNFDMISY